MKLSEEFSLYENMWESLQEANRSGMPSPEEYFDNILAFCEELDWGLHPMISYEGIDNAIDNYEWFKRKFRQFRINHGSAVPMYLEVRNPGWNEMQL